MANKRDPFLTGVCSDEAFVQYAAMEMTPEKALAELVQIAVGHVPGDNGESGALTADGMHSEADAICAPYS